MFNPDGSGFILFCWKSGCTTIAVVKCAGTVKNFRAGAQLRQYGTYIPRIHLIHRRYLPLSYPPCSYAGISAVIRSATTIIIVSRPLKSPPSPIHENTSKVELQQRRQPTDTPHEYLLRSYPYYLLHILSCYSWRTTTTVRIPYSIVSRDPLAVPFFIVSQLTVALRSTGVLTLIPPCRTPSHPVA